jgi:hypothetical protein
MGRQNKPAKYHRPTRAQFGADRQKCIARQQKAERRQRGRRLPDWPGMIRLSLPPNPGKADDDS